MHKPLSLYSNHAHAQQAESNSKSSSIYKYADSLAFSMTEDKHISNKSSFFGEDKHQKVSQQLQSLQIKLEDLETQIMPITIESAKSSNKNKTIKYNYKFDRDSTTEYFRKKNILSQGKQNKINHSNAGKIVRRKQESNQKLIKTILKRNKVENQSNNSKNSLITDTSELLQKSKEVSKLKKEIEVMRTSLEKSQRSMSLCSQQLSASKSALKSMKVQQKKYEKHMDKLKQELKKSETIREKQKKIILSQRRQLQKCRQILKKFNKN